MRYGYVILFACLALLGLGQAPSPYAARIHASEEDIPEMKLKPIHTSQDAGFFDLITFRGKVFAGTYHNAGKPALVYRAGRDVSKWTLETKIVGAESVYVFAKDAKETTLIFNTERAVRDENQTAWIRKNAAQSWRRINDAPSWTFGLGAGFGLGRLWVGNNNGDVWYSENRGTSWTQGPRVPVDSTAVGFIEFNGKLYAGQNDWKHGDSHLYRLSTDRSRWETVSLPKPPDGKRWWNILGKRGIIWKGHLYMPASYTSARHNSSDGWGKVLRMDKHERFAIVLDVQGGFLSEFAVVKMADRVERLCTPWSNSWSDRANGLHSRLYCTFDGSQWEKCAEFDEPFAWGITSRGANEIFVGTMGVRNTAVKGKIYYQKF